MTARSRWPETNEPVAPPLSSATSGRRRLPAAPNGVGDITFDRRIERCGLRRNAAIHFVELCLDRLEGATQRARHAIGSGG